MRGRGVGDGTWLELAGSKASGQREEGVEDVAGDGSQSPGRFWRGWGTVAVY